MTIIAAVISSLGGLYYLYETITGKARPNRITWLLWGIFPLVTFFAQKAQGVQGLSYINLTSAATPLLIVTMSYIRKNAYWQTRPLDYACLVAAGFGIILWALTKNPNLAIVFSIFADLCAALPTLKKSCTHPESESWKAYALSVAGFGLGLATITEWTFQNYAFISYLFGINALLALVVLVRRQTIQTN